MICLTHYTSFENCPLEGCGGDPLLNAKKNREDQPTSDIERVTRSKFNRLKFPTKCKAGTPRELLERWGEGDAVEFEAFLIKITHYTSGMESCNCNLKKEENNDFHLVLVDKKSKPEEDSITAEISPRTEGRTSYYWPCKRRITQGTLKLPTECAQHETQDFGMSSDIER